MIQYYNECFVYFYSTFITSKSYPLSAMAETVYSYPQTIVEWKETAARKSCKTTTISHTLPASLLLTRKVISFTHDGIGLTHDRTVNTHDTICLINDIGKVKQCSW